MNLEPDQLSAQILARIRDTDLGDIDGSLASVTRFMVELGVADSASITERTADGQLVTRAATDELAVTVDRIQYELHEGPCVDAAHDHGLVSSRDVHVDPRWPRWGPPAADAGVGAVISVQLASSTQTLGALNLFYSDRREHTDEQLDAARLVAGHAGVELAHARHDAHLWRAVDARHRVGQAQGILMERFQIDDQKAFGVLRRLSQQSNTKLHLVADHLIHYGRLPDAPPTSAQQTSDPHTSPVRTCP